MNDWLVAGESFFCDSGRKKEMKREKEKEKEKEKEEEKEEEKRLT